MATTIQIKRSATPANTPTLGAGELGINYGAGTQANAGDRLYTGTGSAVHTIGGKYFTDMLDQVAGTLTLSSAVLVDANKAVDEIIVGNSQTVGGSVKFKEGTNNAAHHIELKAPNALVGNVTFTLPNALGSNTQFLQTNASGVMSWATVTSSLTLAADSGTADTFTTGETLTFTGGTGISTAVADNAITFAIDSTVATLVGAQTLTTKSIDLGDNTLTGTVAEFNAALQSESFATLTGTETLTGKTLTTPVIAEIDSGSTITLDATTDIILDADGGDVFFKDDGTTIATLSNVSSGDFVITTGVEDKDFIVKGDDGGSAITALTLDMSDAGAAIFNSTVTAGALVADNVTIDGNTISTTDTNGNLVLSPNGSGTIDAATSKIVNVTDPAAAQDAATKAYVDATSNGLDVKASVDVATTADLAYTYNNGTLGVNATLTNSANGVITLDGIALTADMRVLVKDQSGDVFENGIYYVSTVGAVGAALVLKRATDADTAAKLTGGAFTFVEQGSTQQDNGYVFTHNGTPTIGSTNLPVSQFSGAGQITAGTGLTKSGNTINAGGSTTIIANADTLEVNSSATQYEVLVSGGTALTAATFGQLSLNQSAAVTGTLGYANGGTGLSAWAKGSVVVANAANTLSALDGGGSNDGLLLYTATSDTIAWSTTLDGGSF